MQPAKIMIVEDEGIIAHDIASKLERQGYHVTAIASAADEALRELDNEIPDLVLLDISLKGKMDGIQLAEAINQRGDGILIIYISALSDMATLERAKLTMPHAYLTKPFRDVDLTIAMELAFKRAATDGQKVGAIAEPTGMYRLKDRCFIKVANGRFEKIMFQDILYVEADRSYCCIYVTDQKYTLTQSLNNLLDSIAHPQLLRIHKSYAVNIHKIEAFLDNCVLINSKQIPIGAAYRPALKQQFNFQK